jgi:tetratricopeptide (TPR) repeat protein
MGQQQVQQPAQVQTRKQSSWRRVIIVIIIAAFLLAFACLVLWNLINEGVLHGAFFDTLSKILVAIGSATAALGGILTVYIGIASALKTFLAPSTNRTEQSPGTGMPATTTIPVPPSMPTIIPPPQPANPQSPVPIEASAGNITGSFPPTDPKTIQQRREVVEEVYAELTKPGINCIVLTGIGGIGKSTVAALVYKYAEEQREDGKGPFTAKALWITVEETTATFSYLAETISAALGKSIPDVAKLPPQNQAAALFYVLNMPDHPHLIVINQFENLLDSQTGQASDPGLGEWLDILNSRLCRCRVLLTSRPMPRGTQDYPPTHMQEYPVAGLATNEGVDLLRKQGVQVTQATEAELRTAVVRCAGHALSLELLASILRRNQSLSLHSLFNNPIYAQLWTGDIARKLLDFIYEQQLNDVQRQLLRAFSVYREPIPLEAAQVLLEVTASQTQALDALNILLSQHLLQDIGKECYQLHAIVAEYARRRFVERDEQANKQALRAAHAKAARYYLQQAATSCPPPEKRRVIEDVKSLIEAFWQYCQAGQWQEAYDLVRQEGVFADLKDWGSNAILLELCQLFLPLDNWQPQPWQESDIYYYLGRAYEVLGQKKQAIGYYERALEINKREKNRQGEGAMLNNLGRVYKALGKQQEALSYYQQALAIRREVGDRGGEGATLWNMGALYFEQGHYDVALASLLLARDIFEEVQSPNRDGVQSWIDALRRKVGEEQFTTLLAQVESQASQIVDTENSPR